MGFSQFVWSDHNHTGIIAQDENGFSVFIPADPENKDFSIIVNGLPANPEFGQEAIAPAVIADPD